MRFSRRNSSGQSLTEFAIVVPVLFLLILIIVDLGRITYAYSSVHNAAREGARYGVINPVDTANIESTARHFAIGLDQSSLTIVPLYNGITEQITVTAVYEFRTASFILKLLTGSDSFTLRAVSRMYTEE